MGEDEHDVEECQLVASYVFVDGVIDGHVALDVTTIDSDGDLDGAVVPLHPSEALRLAGRLIWTAGACWVERRARRP